jgi:hypothetical protein
MTTAHLISAQKIINGKKVVRKFTLTAWNAMPSLKVGNSIYKNSGWIQITEKEVPEEVKEIEVKKIKKEVPDKPIEAMSGKELLLYIQEKGLKIEGFDTMTKAELVDAICKIQA